MQSIQYSSQILIKLQFLDRVSKNSKMSYFMNVRLMVVDLFHTDRRTDRNDRFNNGFSLFILVINQFDAQNLFYSKFISCLYMFRAPCAHRQEVKIVLYSLWYHHTYRLREDSLNLCTGRPPICVMTPEAV